MTFAGSIEILGIDLGFANGNLNDGKRNLGMASFPLLTTKVIIRVGYEYACTIVYKGDKPIITIGDEIYFGGKFSISKCSTKGKFANFKNDKGVTYSCPLGLMKTTLIDGADYILKLDKDYKFVNLL